MEDRCYIPGADPTTCPACHHRPMRPPHYGRRSQLWIRTCAACGVSTYSRVAPPPPPSPLLVVRPVEVVHPRTGEAQPWLLDPRIRPLAGGL